MNLRLFGLVLMVSTLVTQYACFTLTPTTLTFAPQVVTKVFRPSPPQRSRLTSAGTAALQIYGIGSANASFVKADTCVYGVPLKAHTSCLITVWFTPQSLGNNSGGVKIYSNEYGPPRTLPLSGFGILPIVSLRDSDGNSKADILWRHQTTGANALWLVSSMSVQNAFLLPALADVNWEIVGVGDFDGDGEADILWRHAITGQNQVWFLNGTNTLKRTAFLPDLPSRSWQVVAVGDVNHDGIADIAWNDSFGSSQIWVTGSLSGQQLNVAQQGPLPTVTDLNWQLVGGGDLDGDGNTDLVWRHATTGDVAVWFVNGTSLTSATVFANVQENWQITAFGDFDGDGKTDIFLHDFVGHQNAVWLMNGSTITGSALLPNEDYSVWQVAGAGDFDGDGKDDLLWRNIVTGQNAVWLMAGTNALKSSGLLPTVADENWQVR
jgi:hypothetical protein